jgi:hypothetical protein
VSFTQFYDAGAFSRLEFMSIAFGWEVGAGQRGGRVVLEDTADEFGPGFHRKRFLDE